MLRFVLYLVSLFLVHHFQGFVQSEILFSPPRHYDPNKTGHELICYDSDGGSFDQCEFNLGEKSFQTSEGSVSRNNTYCSVTLKESDGVIQNWRCSLTGGATMSSEKTVAVFVKESPTFRVNFSVSNQNRLEDLDNRLKNIDVDYSVDWPVPQMVIQCCQNKLCSNEMNVSQDLTTFPPNGKSTEGRFPMEINPNELSEHDVTCTCRGLTWTSDPFGNLTTTAEFAPFVSQFNSTHITVLAKPPVKEIFVDGVSKNCTRTTQNKTSVFMWKCTPGNSYQIQMYSIDIVSSLPCPIMTTTTTTTTTTTSTTTTITATTTTTTYTTITTTTGSITNTNSTRAAKTSQEFPTSPSNGLKTPKIIALVLVVFAISLVMILGLLVNLKRNHYFSGHVYISPATSMESLETEL